MLFVQTKLTVEPTLWQEVHEAHAFFTSSRFHLATPNEHSYHWHDGVHSTAKIMIVSLGTSSENSGGRS